MSLLTELERRNVLRVAIGYLAAAWLLIQIADTVLPRLGVPDSAVSVIIVILAIGFLPILILSWVFEWTPDGWKHDRNVTGVEARSARRHLNGAVILILVLATGFFALDKFLIDPARDAERERAVAQQARSNALIESYGDKSIAVLPFANLSADPDQEYFADGIAEELLNLLAKIPELRVISRNTAFTFKGHNLPIPEIASKLNVSYVLAGSVRRSPSRVRISVQLIDARSDTHLWSEIYDRVLEDVFDVQNEISERVVSDLRVALLGAAPRAEPVEPEVYMLFLKARELLHQTSDSSRSQQAIVLLEQARAIEPDWQPLLFELARAHFRMDSGNADSGEHRAEVYRLVRQMDLIAPDGQTAAIWNGWLAWQWEDDEQTAAQFFERAVALNPRELDLLRPLVSFLLHLRRYDLAEAVSGYLVARDPACAVCIIGRAEALRYTGHSREAAEVLETFLQWHPPNDTIYWRIGVGWLVSGDAERAVHFFELQAVPPDENLGRLLALHDLGKTQEFSRAFARFRKTGTPESIARIYAWTGDADAAFRWLDEAVRQDGPVIAQQVRTDLYVKLHPDPRWNAFLAANGAIDDDLSRIRFNPVFPPDIVQQRSRGTPNKPDTNPHRPGVLN